MIRKFHEAKERGDQSMELWGTGSPMREFLYADDLAEACLFLMETYNESELVNIGTGVDVHPLVSVRPMLLACRNWPDEA